MDDLNLHYRFLNWRRRIREIREVRAGRYQERAKHILVDGDTLRYRGGVVLGAPPRHPWVVITQTHTPTPPAVITATPVRLAATWRHGRSPATTTTSR